MERFRQLNNCCVISKQQYKPLNTLFSLYLAASFSFLPKIKHGTATTLTEV